IRYKVISQVGNTYGLFSSGGVGELLVPLQYENLCPLLHHQAILPAALNKTLPVISKSIEAELRVSQSLAWKYTTVLEKLMDSDNQPEDCDMPSILLKQALYNVRQHEVFLKVLLDDARLCAQHVESLQLELSSQMKLLKETVQSKPAVPTAKVFPLFKALSKLWSGLQDEAALLNILSNMKLNLQPFLASQAKIFSEAYLDGLLRESEVKTDEQRMTESADERIVPAEMETQEWLLPEATASINHLLQYNGVCGYTLVSRDGLLLPGNPHIGVLKYKEKLYVFTSKKAALEFASCPDSFIAEVAEKAKLSPELIQLLKLHQQFSCVSPYSEVRESLLVNPITKCESGTQTDIHPVETNIVKSYEWNEWELRRKAIKRVSLNSQVVFFVISHLSISWDKITREQMIRYNQTGPWTLKGYKSPSNDATSDKKNNIKHKVSNNIY
uniref:Cilia- and flagella-associated protein 206 n=1 Tax=Seriola lalandi dorsalis TaxID=1841481 RepID=A0A3B4XBL5_SERLL